MGRSASRKRHRGRVGQVSYYQHHGGWWLYFREDGRPIRRRVADSEEAAKVVAAQVNVQLASSAPTLFSFTPLPVPELRRRFLEYHEFVLRSSLATVARYRAATQHLENFAESYGTQKPAHEFDVEQFIRYLRAIRVSSNGHPRTPKRPLRDKGIRFILETCRSLFSYAGKKRHLPPYSENPFVGLGSKQIRVENPKPIFVFNEQTELAFLNAADHWSFPIHFVLAKTGLRPGELVHLLVEDVDLPGGWLFIRNKPELGWRIKAGRERAVPLIDEVVVVLRKLIGGQAAGVVFHREQFKPAQCPLAFSTRAQLAEAVASRIGEEANRGPLSRAQEARITQTVWRDAGATKADRIRQSFISITRDLQLPNATCPKSWRHTFATLLQDANVDPLIRQLTLGHSSGFNDIQGLGMTGVYTHTRLATQRREIKRALQLWPAALELCRRK